VTVPLDGNWIVDADGHVVEAADIWERYLPEPYRGSAPRLVASGGFPGLPSSDSSDAVEKLLAVEGGTDPSRRGPDMDLDGIGRAVLFPTLGLMMQHLTEPDLSDALHRAINDWLADYCSYDRTRFIGVAAIPATSGQAALAEAKRCVEDLGYRAVFRRPDVPVGALPIHDPGFEPLWSYLESQSVPVLCHSGSPPRYYQDRFPAANIAVHSVHFVTEAMLALASFVLFGVLERHPGLRVGFVECGAGWALAACHRLDEHVEKAAGTVVHYSLPVPLSARPSEYFRTQCFVTVEDCEPGLAAVLQQFPGSVMFATDYPHPDGVFPGSTASLLKAEGLAQEQRRAVLRDNAIRLYELGG
jgi:uncharacterized protein